jgi:hypothetical protein
MKIFNYGACNKDILIHNEITRKKNTTRLHGWLFGDKLDEVAEASASVALTVKKTALIAIEQGIIITGEVSNVSGNGTELLGNVTGLVRQFQFAGQGLAFSCSLYHTGIAMSDFSLCPDIGGKLFYGGAALCSGASVILTGCSIGTGTVSPASSYTLGMSGVALRSMSRYMRKAGRLRNPLSIEAIL